MSLVTKTLVVSVVEPQNLEIERVQEISQATFCAEKPGGGSRRTPTTAMNTGRDDQSHGKRRRRAAIF